MNNDEAAKVMAKGLNALGLSSTEPAWHSQQPSVLTSYVEIEVNVDRRELEMMIPALLPTFLLGRLLDKLAMDRNGGPR